MKWISVLLSLATGLLLVLTVNELFPVKMEYKIIAIQDATLEREMDLLGFEGWELVSTRRAMDSDSKEFSYEMFFKREYSILSFETWSAMVFP